MRNLLPFLLLLLWAPSAHAACVATASVEICGNGIDDDCSGTYNSCGAGEVNAFYSRDGCDKLCDAADKDQDGDGYTSTGTGGLYSGLGTDCDDTKGDIYPGVTTASGCSAGQWRTCQSNGTYTSCSAADFCPSGCTSCRYIDAVSGNNANNGTTKALAWADYRMFTSYYAAPDQPAGYEAPASGRCYLFLDGTYSYTYLYNTDTVGLFLRSWTNTSGNHGKVMAYPGHAPVFDLPGTNIAPRVPLVLTTSTYVDIYGLTASGNYVDGVREPNAFVIGIDDSQNIDVSGMRVFDNQGITSSNFAGIGTETAASYVNIHHNWVQNNYTPAGSGVDTQIMSFRGNGNKIWKNTVAISANDEADGIRQKHADFVSDLSVKGNSVGGGFVMGISLCGGNFVAENNILSDIRDHAFKLADNGGTSFQTGTMSISKNTVLKSKLLLYNPQIGYNVDNTNAADKCSGNATPGTLTVSNNIIKDNSASYPGESELVTMDVYGPDSLRTAFLTSGKTLFTGNCYYNTLGTALAFDLYASNNADLTCSGRGNNGQTYSSWATWVAAGYETSSYNEDPSLDAYLKSSSTNCPATSKGWNAGLSGAGGSTPAATTSTAHLINQCLLRHRR